MHIMLAASSTPAEALQDCLGPSCMLFGVNARQCYVPVIVMGRSAGLVADGLQAAVTYKRLVVLIVQPAGEQRGPV